MIFPSIWAAGSDNNIGAFLLEHLVIVIADILKSDGGTRAGRRRPPLEAPRRREPKETTEERWRQCGEAAARGGGPGGSVMFTDCSDPHTHLWCLAACRLGLPPVRETTSRPGLRLEPSHCPGPSKQLQRLGPGPPGQQSRPPAPLGLVTVT